MATPQPIPFWTQSNESRSKTITAERLVNWFLEKNTTATKFPYALFPTPGLKKLTQLGAGPCRGIKLVGDLLWVVSGNKLYTLDSSLNATEVGLIGGLGDVRMDSSDTTLLIATTNAAYYADLGGVVALPESSVNGLAYIDGIGVLTKRGTQQFFASEVDNLKVWPGSRFSSADATADFLMGCAMVQRFVWLFKQFTTEIWFNTGNATFPFERNPSGFLHYGCAASNSIAILDNTVFWLGHDNHVYRATGFDAQRISTPAISRDIEQRSSSGSSAGFVYSLGGHTFYVLSFADRTMAYDLATGLWHYRKTQGFDRWRANGCAMAWGKAIVGDCANGNIYELRDDVYTDDGATIRREADSPPLFNAGSLMQMHELFIDAEMGVGLDGAVQGSDPELMLSWSDDFGNTWGNEIPLRLGKIGERALKASANRLGTFRQRSMRIAISDPVPAIITGAYARIEALNA